MKMDCKRVWKDEFHTLPEKVKKALEDNDAIVLRICTAPDVIGGNKLMIANQEDGTMFEVDENGNVQYWKDDFRIVYSSV